ncbi:MAG TPA: hypothetical protein VFE51_18080 [Verrucomicrobiae bacterium]|nr:hypothetical protein [Verrucomicrobiae bacterium]
MSFGFSKFGVCAAISALLCLGLAGPRVQAQGQQKPRRFIELSETNSGEILTNLNRITARKEGVDQLEDQLRVIRSLTPKNLETRFNAPYNNPTVVPRKTLMELLDRQRNWGMTAEELGGPIGSSKDLDLLSLYGDEKLGGKSSSLQQFYDNLNRSGTGHQNPNRPSDNSGSNDLNKRSDLPKMDEFGDDAKLPPGLRDKAEKLRELVNEDPDSIFNRSKPKTSFDNFFGLKESNAASDDARGPKTSMESFMDQFKKVLDGSGPAVQLNSGLNALLPAGSTPRAVVRPSVEQLPTSSGHEFTQSATPGTVTSIASPATLPDVNAAVLNRWNPLYSPAKIEPPKITPPTPPNFDFPRRHF